MVVPSNYRNAPDKCPGLSGAFTSSLSGASNEELRAKASASCGSGTHALKSGSRSTLWGRLKQHQGVTKSGGGNHRGSIFRIIIGEALKNRVGYSCPSWGEGSSASKEVRKGELSLEQAVSATLGSMSFLWLRVEDEPGPNTLRGYIERNTIALLSNYSHTPIDLPSLEWLGRHSGRARVRRSGLWDSNHVDETYDPAFLDILKRLIAEERCERGWR